MTGASLLAYIKRTFKRSDKDTELYEAITDTIIDIKLRYEHDAFKVEAYSTSIAVAGDYKIDAPSDSGHIIGNVRCEDGTNSVELKKVSKQQFDELEPNPNASGVTTAMPSHWCLFGEQILLYPVPNKTTYAYEFSYTEEAAEDVVAGTSVVPFSVKNRECLKAGALYRMFRDLEDDTNATKWFGIYETEIAKIETADRRNTDAPAQVKFNDL